MPGRATLQVLLSQHLSNISAARHRTLKNTDPEGLHDLRVAIRGLRAILPLLGAKKRTLDLRIQWKTFAQATGPCRDLEVLLALLSQYPEAPIAIREQLTAEELKARSVLFHMLASAKLPLLLQYSRTTVNNLLLRQPREAICQRAQRRADNLLNDIHMQILILGEKTNAQDWHTLRLTIKRLRYLIEHGGNWLPKHWRRMHTILKQSQTSLGDLHDMDMLLENTKLDTGPLHDVRQREARNAIASLVIFLNSSKASKNRQTSLLKFPARTQR